MAENKTTIEREYIIPLKSEWRKVPSYKRARKGIVAIKQYIAKHMKVTDRDVKNVKVDIYLNNELWSRGSSYSPPRVKVKAVKQGDIVVVSLVDIPESVRFAKIRQEKRHKKSDKKAEVKEEKKEEKTVEEKKEESEKGKAVADLNEKLAEQQAKAQKHTTPSKSPEIHRMALKK